jgi:DNA polymerase III sliding clamp (beta) subunit (PCNA family)
MNTKALKKSLEPLARLASKKHVLPALNNIYVHSDNGVMKLRASDGYTFAERILLCNDMIAPCLVHGNRFSSYINSELEVSFSETEAKLIVVGSGRMELAKANISEYPAWPDPKFTPLGITCEMLANGIEAVKFAAMPTNFAEGSNRHALACICIKAEPKRLIAAAFEGHMLALHMEDSINAESSFLILNDFAVEIISQLREEESEFGQNENQLMVRNALGYTIWPKPAHSPESWPLTTMMAQVNEGFELISNAPTCPLKDCVGFAKQFVAGELPREAVWLKFVGDGVTVEGGGYSRKIEAKCAPLEILFNPSYLFGCLSSMPTPVTKFSRRSDFASKLESGNMTCLIKELSP